jgi:plasmid stabilization system protein ParE
MATIAWTKEAQQWIEDIFEYIAADNPHAARRTVQDIFDRAQVLASHPEIGHRYTASTRMSEFCYLVITELPTW